MLAIRSFLTLTLSIVVALTLLAPPSAAADKPVKVFILAGQSSMVGIGQVTGGGSRWGSEFIAPVLSVYPGKYDPETDYDSIEPAATLKLEKFGGVKPTPYLGGGTQIVRGFVQIKTTGVYELRPGYGGSTYKIMEVYRREPGRKAVHTHFKLTEGRKVPFRITYLTDQANGLGWIARVDIPGTLATVVQQDGKFPYLIDDQSNWIDRKDVWYRGVATATADQWRSVGCGAGDHRIGPELGFGHLVGDYHEEPVLILKAYQGNRSLGWDYLPPGSERFEHDGFAYAGYRNSPARWEKGTKRRPINWYAGKQYDDCFAAAHEVLKNFDTEFPHWKGRGYEIAGFAWLQGFNDMVSRDEYPQLPKDSEGNRFAEYSELMGDFIRDVRKALDAPQMPFVIGVMGVGGDDANGANLEFRKAMAAPAALPEFKGNVVAVPTSPFWDEPLAAIQIRYEKVRQMAYLLRTKNRNAANADGSMSKDEQRTCLKEYEAKLVTPEEVTLRQRGASNAGYHYLGCVRTFALMGKAFATAILEMRSQREQR